MLYRNLQTRLRTILIILLMLGAALTCIQLFSHTSFSYDSFSFDLKVNLATDSGTSLAIPPVGRLFFKNHRIPWQIVITLNEIDFNRLEKQLGTMPPSGQWLDLLQNKLKRAFLILFIIVILAGLGGSSLALLFLRVYPNQPRFWQGVGLTFLMTVGLIGGTLLTYDPTAIERPQYQGVLASAPWAMNLINMGLEHVEVIGNNLKNISQSLSMLYIQAGQTGSLSTLDSDLSILHVSDIHNNPAAFDLIDQLIETFKVQLVIDTGDLTDYGTVLESEIVKRIETLSLPYFFVPGNHDSPLIINRLRQLDNVRVLLDTTVNFNGLTIFGLADPAAAGYNPDGASPEQLNRSRDELTQKITAASPPPDLVVIHNRYLAQNMPGKVSVILHGHDHRYGVTVQKNTVIVDGGTTGAAGLRGLTKKGVPYSASILYWKKDSQGKSQLHAIDSLKINGVEGKFSLERHTYPETTATAGPAPTTAAMPSNMQPSTAPGH
jgi:predicted phosphodiesterase